VALQPRRIALLFLVAIAASTVSACVPQEPAANARSDVDLVIVLPALDHRTFAREKQVLRPWLRAQRTSYAFVSLQRVLGGRDASFLTAEVVRRYLRDHFTWRTSTAMRPRYLGIFAPPTSTYFGSANRIATIPRFDVSVDASSGAFTSDVPFEFLSPSSIGAGDGILDPGDLDLTAPTFDMFRVPVGSLADFRTFVRRHSRFATSSSRNDATLVAGEFGLFPGDTSVVQCLNAANLTSGELATRVFKVLDSTAACAPDVLTTAAGPRLADFLTDPESAFQGGTIVDVSHGNSTAIYGKEPDGTFFPNLTADDAAHVPADRLNVFISIACDNDATDTAPNLAAAMYDRSSVAVISATTAVTPVNLDDILFAEVDSITGLYQHQQNLLQRLHEFRSEYYRRFVTPATGFDQQLLWTNLLAVDLVGDGLVTVAREPRPDLKG
jgi:peptidase C25-like protein